MCNRKRRIAQPMLESMEPRVVPSAVSIHAGEGHAVPANVAQMNETVKQAKASQRKNNEALQRLQHQQHIIYVHSLERTPSAAPTEAQKVASSISNLFKNLGQSL
jgi:hypothetical protein